MKKVLLVITTLVIVAVLIILGINIWLRSEMEKPFKASKTDLEHLSFFKQSDQWFVDHLEKPPIQLDGQRLDPKFQYMLEYAGDPDKNFKTMKRIFSTALGRQYVRYQMDREWTLYTKITSPMKKTYDLEVKGRDGHQIPIRIYVPDVADTLDKLPVLVYAHGGGYLFGSIKALDRAVQLIANEAGVIVVSVDYRLSPEHPYPAQAEDGEDVFDWTKSNIQKYGGDPEKIGCGGDSGGGLVAINIAQRQLDKDAQIPSALLLYYPATGLPIHDSSYELFGKGFGLDAKFFEYVLTNAFPDQQLETADPDDYMAPLQSNRHKGMPTTILATAGFDILRDTGKKYADKLRIEGTEVFYKNYPSMIHSFLNFSGVIEDAETAAIETARLFGQKIRE